MTELTQPTSNAGSAKLKTCSCGHDRYHHFVNAECEYSGLGWFWVTMGITTKPKKVKFRCRRCREMFDESIDEHVLKEHT